MYQKILRTKKETNASREWVELDWNADKKKSFVWKGAWN